MQHRNGGGSNSSTGSTLTVSYGGMLYFTVRTDPSGNGANGGLSSSFASNSAACVGACGAYARSGWPVNATNTYSFTLPVLASVPRNGLLTVRGFNPNSGVNDDIEFFGISATQGPAVCLSVNNVGGGGSGGFIFDGSNVDYNSATNAIEGTLSRTLVAGFTELDLSTSQSSNQPAGATASPVKIGQNTIPANYYFSSVACPTLAGGTLSTITTGNGSLTLTGVDWPRRMHVH